MLKSNGRHSTINIGKFGNFPSSELVGKWPGFSYDIVSHKLHILPPRTIEELEDTNANNELINDGSFVQPLTHPEIEELKRSGASFTEIWKRQTEQHANYELKTEYSKEKYKKRKEAKFAKRVTIIEPTIFNVCDYWFTRDPSRVRDMRPDTLSQIISMANVQSGSRIIIVDDTGGLILAAALDRMGGSGTVVAISDSSQAPSYPCISSMNFSPEQLKPLSTLLNWVHVDEEWAPIRDFSEPIMPSFSGVTYESPEAAALHRKFERDNARIIKRREAFLALQAHREDLFSGEWDALLISSNHEPHSIIEKLAPYLAGSSSIIVHSPYVHVLTEAQVKLRADPQYLGSSITEGWLRRYQILPGRTHPTMQTSGSGGYLLQTIKVYPAEGAVSTLALERKIQRQRQAAAKRKRKAAEAAAGGNPNAPKKKKVGNPGQTKSKIKSSGKGNEALPLIAVEGGGESGMIDPEPENPPLDVDMLNSPTNSP